MGDRSLHVLLHYLAATNEGARSDVAVFKALAAEVPDVSEVDIVAAAKHAKALGSELRKLAWRIEQARKRGKWARPRPAAVQVVPALPCAHQEPDAG
jgi:hypothetical protein